MKEAVQRTSSAWWVWLVAAAFLLNFGLILRGDWSGPTLGLSAAYNQGSVIVLNVYALPETVPLRQGDRIIRADEQDISSDSDWFVVGAETYPARLSIEPRARRIHPARPCLTPFIQSRWFAAARLQRTRPKLWK